MPYDHPYGCHLCKFTCTNYKNINNAYDNYNCIQTDADELRQHYLVVHKVRFTCMFCKNERWFPRDLGAHLVRDHYQSYVALKEYFSHENKFLAFASGAYNTSSVLFGMPDDVLKLIHTLWNNARDKWYEEAELGLWCHYRTNKHQVYLNDVQEKMLEFLQHPCMRRLGVNPL